MHSQSEARIEKVKLSVKSLRVHRKTTASIKSTPFNQIPTFGSPVSSKPPSSIRLYFENVNGLSTDVKSWKRNWKCKKLPYLWRRLNVDLMSLVETQAQPALLDATCNTPSTLFAHETHVTKLSNNSNELINKHQQGGLMSSVRGECCKLVTATSCDPTGLARWQSIDLKNANGKIRFITAYQGVPSKQTSNTVHQQQLRYWQRHNRNICPRKAFALDIKEHLHNSLQEGFAIILCLDSNEDMTSGRLF